MSHRNSSSTLIRVIVLLVCISITDGSLQRHVARDKTVIRKKLFDTKGREFKYKSIRIPKDVKPFHYDLFIHPNLEELTFQGRVRIKIRCFKNTRRVIFHVKNLRYENIKLTREETGEDNIEIKVKDIAENKELNLVTLELENQLKVNEKYVLSMDFEGEISNNMEGFYKSSYMTKDGETR